ncbi:MAG: PQQ-binding-like beta-propeller repeat protein [Planctomycetia bacterium]|nr:PQQ-binding-like beta-propeller repeat protein [Planctomycetia bacterium]
MKKKIFIGLIGCWSLWLAGSQILFGEEGTEQIAEEEREPVQTASVFPQADRRITKSISDAKKLIERERYAEAAQKLGEILGESDDFLVPGVGEEEYLFHSLRFQAENLLKNLPPRGRELYELQFGPAAEQLFQEGLGKGDIALLSQASRQYFYTQAGEKATFLIAIHHLDHNRPIPASVLFRKLYETEEARRRFDPILTLFLATSLEAVGKTEESKEILTHAANENPAIWKSLRLGGKPLEVEKETSLAQWLQGQLPRMEKILPEDWKNWRMLHGNLQRNALVEADMPIFSPCWRVPVLDHPEGLALVELLRRHGEEGSLVDIPVSAPLVVDGVVLMRTIWNLTALDLFTGKRLWEVPSDHYEDIFQRLDEVGKRLYGMGDSSDFNRLTVMAGILKSRLWGEGLYGSLSSHGELVYAIEDSLDTLESNSVQQRAVMQRIQVAPPVIRDERDASITPNRLAAYHIRSGKLVWHIGGTSPKWNLPESGTMFLGAPLPVGRELFVLGQREGEILLFALDATTGKTKWKQTLCLASTNFSTRHEPAMSPSYADGILVCPTPNRTLVAVDIATQSILWGNVYAPEDAMKNQNNIFSSRMIFTANDPRVDGSILLEDQHVVYIPRDIHQMICLNLTDGKELWRTVTGEGHYIAAIRKEKVYIVRPKDILVLNLRTSEKIGSIHFPEGEVSGYGFGDESFYFVPLSTGKIVKVDWEKREVVETVQAREGWTPGNLVPAKPFILSQKADYLEAYLQKRELPHYLATLQKANPEAPEGLILEAIEAWDAGDLPKATEHLRRGGHFTRRLLFYALLDGIRNDFNHFDEARQEIYPLLETKRDKIRFHQFAIQGLQKAGRWEEMLAECRTLMELLDTTTQTGETLLEETKNWQKSANLWLATQFEKFWQMAEVKPLLEKEIAETLQQIAEKYAVWKTENPTEGIPANEENWNQPLLSLVRQTLERWKGVADLREPKRIYGEMLQYYGFYSHAELFFLEGVKDDTQRKAAFEKIVRMYGKSETAENAIPYFRWLLEHFPEEKCLEGQTPRQWCLARKETHPIRQWLHSKRAWKTGQIQVSQVKSTSESRQMFYREQGLQLEEPCALPFQDWKLTFGYSSEPAIFAEDSYGQKCWSMKLGQNQNIPQQIVFWNHFNDSAASGATAGHWLYLSRGNGRVIALDISRKEPKIGWEWSPPKEYTHTDPLILPLVERLEKLSLPFANTSGFSANTMQLMGIVYADEEVVCMILGEKLVGLDAATGTMLWERNLREENEPATTLAMGKNGKIFVTSDAQQKIVSEKQRPLMEPLILRNVSNQEIQEQTSQDQQRREALKIFHENYVWREKYFQPGYFRVYDAHTGLALEKKSAPYLNCWGELGEVDKKLLFLLGVGNAALYDPEKEQFDWIRLENLPEDAPHWQRLRSRIGKGNSPLGVASLNARWELEIFDFRTGNVALKTAPLLPEGAPENPLWPTREKVSNFHVLPDEQGGYFIALTTSPEDVQENILVEDADESEENSEENAEEPTPAEPQEEKIQISEIYNVASEEIYHGLIFHVDKTGKFTWEKPIYVEHSYWMTGIPRKLPLVGLAHMKHRQQQPGRAANVTMAFQFYDARNGRLIYDLETKRISNIMRFRGVPEENKIWLEFPESSLEFHFTDNAYPSEDPKPIRPNLTEEIQKRKAQLDSLRKHRTGLVRNMENITKAYQNQKEPSEMEKKIYEEKRKTHERELKQIDQFIEEESKEIERLEKNNAPENSSSIQIIAG